MVQCVVVVVVCGYLSLCGFLRVVLWVWLVGRGLVGWLVGCG